MNEDADSNFALFLPQHVVDSAPSITTVVYFQFGFIVLYKHCDSKDLVVDNVVNRKKYARQGLRK